PRCIIEHMILPYSALHYILPTSRIYGHRSPPIVVWNSLHKIAGTIARSASSSNECVKISGLLADIFDYPIVIKGRRI
ncbi:MAG: hypothetical protein ACLQDI_13950, partial [Syntrophobacteraceae bacterium]